MLCFVYKSLKKDELYLYVNKKDDFSSIPEALYNSLGRLQFVMELTLSPKRKLAREDVSRVMTSLETKGFFVQMPPVMAPPSLVATHRQLH